MHHSAIAAMGNFMLIKRGEATAINIKLSQVKNERIQQNREKLIPIIKTVAFCGRQNIVFRGHRDDETLEETTWNKGNFRALLDFRIDSGDTVLQHHFDAAPRNATCKSKTIQNEIIDCIGSFSRDQIIKEDKDAEFCSVIVDETPDVSRKEQMPLSLRYVDRDTGTSANAIASKIKVALSDLGLDLENVRGQVYDGVSNMNGRNAGTARLLTEENNLAIYIHCFAHCLNLSVLGSCKLQVVKNMMNKVRCVSEFFIYPKRAEFLKSQVENLTPQQRHRTLLEVCRTRWISRIDGLNRLEEMFEVFTLTLQSIRDNVGGHWNIDSQNLAGSLFNACCEFTFIVSLLVYLSKNITFFFRYHS